MPAQEDVRSGSDEIHDSEKTHPYRGARETLSHRYNGSYDVESQSLDNQTAPYPGASYGFNAADQPTQPARRVSSIASLRNAASMRTDPTAPHGDADLSHDPDAPPDESVAEELAWNPSHPCYPHPNPHVPLSSPLYEQTRVIRVKRDWMAYGDLAPAFSNLYPEILDPLMPESEFRFVINQVNTALKEAFDPFNTWNWIDGLLGLVTGWLWEDFRPGGIKKKLRGLEFWIEQWNQRVGSRGGVRVIPLRRTGYTCLDIEIPDPQVRVVDPNEEDERERARAGELDEESHRKLRVGDLRRGTTTNGSESQM